MGSNLVNSEMSAGNRWHHGNDVNLDTSAWRVVDDDQDVWFEAEMVDLVILKEISHDDLKIIGIKTRGTRFWRKYIYSIN